MATKDTRWLMRQGETWYAVVEVPPSLRGKLGMRRVKRTLKTQDKAIALVRRHKVVGEIKASFRAVHRTKDGDPLTVEAMEWRTTLKEFADQEDQMVLLRDQLGDRAYALEDTKGYAVAKVFHDLATGKTTPLLTYVDAWVADGKLGGGALDQRTVKERRRAVEKLQEWLQEVHLSPTVEAVTTKVAGRYVSEVLRPSERPVKTVIKAISALRGYWQWMIRRGNVAEGTVDPWAGQAPRKPKSNGRGKDVERAFTDDEVARLLASPPGPTMPDFLRIAALTGMRREEIGQLRVGDCVGGEFVVQAGKTAAAARRVPVHSALAAVVEARCLGKQSGAYLFDEIQSNNPERTDPLGKAFTRYRRSLGIQEGTGRRSLVNLHSFRRWFITAAVNATNLPHMVSLVVGHEEGLKGMTLGRYWAGGDDQALRAVVEAVKLPALASLTGGAG